MIMIKLKTMMNYVIKNFKNLMKLRTCYFETDLKPDNTDIWLFFFYFQETVQTEDCI